MFTKALKLRSSLVLLVTATILLQPAGANSSTTAYVCQDEFGACFSDSECGECLSDFADDVDGWNECVENFEYDAYDVCLIYSMSACCLDALSANDCMGNSAFVGYYTCLADYAIDQTGGDGECSLTCDDADSSANTSGTSGAGSSSPSAMLTYALGLAFLSASRFIGVLL